MQLSAQFKMTIKLQILMRWNVFFKFITYRPSSEGAQVCDSKRDRLWVRFPLEDMKYLFTFIFSFLRSGVEAKRGVE